MTTRLLVVDDEPQFLRALATNLRGAGYDVVTAATAASKRATARRRAAGRRRARAARADA